MKLHINGDWQECPDTCTTLSDVIAFLRVSETGLIVEKDGELFRDHQLAETPVADGATLELIRFMGGG